MRKLLNLALCSALVFCMSTVMAQNPNDEESQFESKCNMSNFHSLGMVNVESANLNEQKQPEILQAKTGGLLVMKKGQYAVVKGTALIGEKNNDDNFRLQHYAKLCIQDKAKLTVNDGGILKIQKDGKLINSGELVLKDGSSLISPLIDMSENSSNFATNTKGDKRLKHGIDNENGIIVINKGSKIYWEEENGDKSKATIYKGTVNFENLFKEKEPREYPNKKDFMLNLEGVTIKLFDPTNENLNISKCELKKIETFQNIYLGNGCVLDGEFDFSPSKSKVIKLSQNQANMLSVLSEGTVVRQKGKSSKFNEELFKSLFENGSNLTINAKPHSEEQINYSLKELLNDFNTESKETILNTDYTTIFEDNDKCQKRLVKTLTSDWENTIDKNILPLYQDQFTQDDNYNMHFKFEGNKNISFVLQGNEKDSSLYQMTLYGDLSKYSPLLNEQLPSNPEEKTNIVNNFIQKYNGASPYLKTNGNTKYTVDLKEKNGNATLRFAENDGENTPIKYASLNNLIIGTESKSASVEIDYSYNNENTPNYAQTLAVGMLKMQNKESQLTIKAGQTLVFGTTNIDDIDINEILEEDWEMGEINEPKMDNVEAKVETASKMAIDSRRATSTSGRGVARQTQTTTTVRPVSKTRVEPRVSALRTEQTTTEQELKIDVTNPEINESKIEKNLLDASEYSDDVIEQSKYSIATEHPTGYYNGNKQNVQENIVNVNPEDVIAKTEDKNEVEQDDDFDGWD